jgi:5'-AMP-activated protein kinase catalytic alpha subunit
LNTDFAEDEMQVVGNYRLTKTLGKGTFGKVKKAEHITTGETVAVKVLQKELICEQADVERISREIKILKLIQHEYLIQLYEIIGILNLRIFCFMAKRSKLQILV